MATITVIAVNITDYVMCSNYMKMSENVEKLTRKRAVSKSCSSQLLCPALFLRSETGSQHDGI